MGLFNATCPLDIKPVDNQPFFVDGNLNFKAHYVGWMFSGICALIATSISTWLILKHAKYYSYPLQQRYIIRILLMIPIYSVVSFLSYAFYRNAIYFQLIRDSYEAFVLGSFFYLLMQYLADDPIDQKEIFRFKEINSWPFPLNCVKYRPTGLYFLQLVKWGILQYVVLRPLCTFIAIITQATGVYCLDSYAPVFAHIYLSVTVGTSVSIAMYFLVAFYFPVRTELASYSPFTKFLCIKAIIFLTFWQDSAIIAFGHFGLLKESEYWSLADIETGLSAILACVEMVIFSLIHVKAFSYRLYRPSDHSKTPIGKSLLHAMNFSDFLKELWSGLLYLKRLFTNKPVDVNRGHDLEVALGKQRRRDKTVKTPLQRSNKFEENLDEKDFLIGNKNEPESISTHDIPTSSSIFQLPSKSRETVNYSISRPSTRDTDSNIGENLFSFSHHSINSNGQQRNGQQRNSRNSSTPRNIYDGDIGNTANSKRFLEEPSSTVSFMITTPQHHLQYSSESDHPLPPIPINDTSSNKSKTIIDHPDMIPSINRGGTDNESSSTSLPISDIREKKRPKIRSHEQPIIDNISEQYGPGSIKAVKMPTRIQRTGLRPLSYALEQDQNMDNRVPISRLNSESISYPNTNISPHQSTSSFGIKPGRKKPSSSRNRNSETLSLMHSPDMDNMDISSQQRHNFTFSMYD